MKKKYGPWLVCLWSGIACYGQQEIDTTVVHQLDEVVVSDSRFPLKREQSGKTVIRLDSADLRWFQGTSVAQVLNQQSGFEVSGSRARPGEVLGIYARGGRGRQVLVLIDGLRVTDPSSFSQEYDLRLLPVSAIESIEILKGAASVLYGANAATAVINIRTKKAADKPLELQLQGSAGTLNPADTNRSDLRQLSHFAQVGGRHNGLDYKAAFSQTYANGLSALDSGSQTDPYSNWSVDLAVGQQVGRNSRLGIFANQTRMRSAYDDSFAMADAPFIFETDQKRTGLTWVWKNNQHQLEFLGAYTTYASDNQSDFPATFEGSNWTGDLVYKRSLGAHLYGLVGLNVIQDKALLEKPEQFSLVDPYLNLVWTGEDGLNLNAGLRLNVHSVYGTQGVYNINPSYSYEFKKGYLKVMGSWATAYITPSLSQLFGAFGANPTLEPETNRTLEAGWELMLKKGVRASLLYFNRQEKNSVLFNNADFVYFNADQVVQVRGLEGELGWVWQKGSSLQLNYTFTEREGEAAIRIPKHKFNLTARTRLSQRVSAQLSYSFTGKRTDTDFTTFTPVELEAFSLLDLRLEYKIIPGRLQGFLSVTNLLDTSYTEVLGFTTPGRNLLIGWNLNL